ncbi:MAG: hypothetical protein KF761_01800 [Salinibacterium sp.]|nr:hypothetical protein [Salinibacterium sp.]
MYEDAYRVPFRLDRRPPVYGLLNTSDERVTGVAITIHGAGVLAANNPATLLPGERLDVTVAGAHLERGTILVVRWRRLDGVEYLWRVNA